MSGRLAHEQGMTPYLCKRRPRALRLDVFLAGAPAKPSAELARSFVMTAPVMTRLLSDASHITPAAGDVN
jgi:hypothetical protein